MDADVKPVDASSPCCKLDKTGCLSLRSILISFNQPISEEQAWAVCYQSTKCLLKEWETNQHGCYCPSDTDDLKLHKDGDVHCPALLILPSGAKVEVATTQYKLVTSLGLLIFHALDFGLRDDEERNLTGPLEQLIDKMTSAEPELQHQSSITTESQLTDNKLVDDHPDEGIERDSCENDSTDEIPASPNVGCSCGQSKERMSLARVLEKCADHLPSPEEADAHYKAVCRALVAEALELSTFLQKISQGTKELRKCTERESDLSFTLDELDFSDWARLWVQVIRELRDGVKLKKVDKNNVCRSIEYELTPYEILMDDIRSRRYKLNKVMINGSLPPRVKKDAHALILDFIRSRPPLVPANRRKLAPTLKQEPTLHEDLMSSIRKEHRLKPLQSEIPEKSISAGNTPQCQRRLIKADLSLLLKTLDDDDEDDDDYFFSPVVETKSLTPELSWQKTVALDLATQSKGTRPPERRHSLTESDLPTQQECRHHNSYLISQVDSNNTSPTGFKYFKSAQTQNALKCLSLTLEEVIHIRNVLTKAELESLLVDRTTFDDVAKGRVCFGCRKTKFSLWRRGTKCRLCMQIVCSRCYSKMRIPTEHFENVPVFTLTPSPSTEEETSPRTSLKMSDLSNFTTIGTGSAPSSPKISDKRISFASDDSSQIGEKVNGQSSPGKRSYQSDESDMSPSSPGSKEKRRPLFRSHTTAGHRRSRPDVEVRREDRIRGSLMNVCDDCREMVKQIIIASRNSLKSNHKIAKLNDVRSNRVANNSSQSELA